jgi:probable F420-dependent oxidoreductase
LSGRPSFGILAYDYGRDDILNLAVHADRLGFDCLWFGEHYVVPRQFTSHHTTRHATETDGTNKDDAEIIADAIRIYDPWFLLGAVAGATRRLKIGTAICIVPMNNPLLLARATVTAHDISGGRFLFGTGAGWLKEEFDAVGVPFAERGPRLDETIAILRKAWGGGYFSHQGAHFSFDPLQISPHPVQIPLVCGGNTGPALRRVADVADAWINSAMVTLDEAIELRGIVERERKARGTADRPFAYYIRPYTVDPDDVGSYVRAGFDNIVLWGPNCWPNKSSVSLDEKVAGLERIARDLRVAP